MIGVVVQPIRNNDEAYVILTIPTACFGLFCQPYLLYVSGKLITLAMSAVVYVSIDRFEDVEQFNKGLWGILICSTVREFLALTISMGIFV